MPEDRTGEDRTVRQHRILNAAYFVRLYARPHHQASGQRRAAVATLAREVRDALNEPGDFESVLYALASGLYERGDPRFC